MEKEETKEISDLTHLTPVSEDYLEKAIERLRYILELDKMISGVSKEEAEAKALDKLTDEDLDTLSLALSDEEVNELVTLRLMAEVYKEPIYHEAVKAKLLYRNNLGAWKAKLVADTIKESRKEQRLGLGFFGRFFRRKKKEEEGLETVEIE